MGSILVRDRETGSDLAIDEADFDTAFHELKEGQHVVVDPGASGVIEQGGVNALALTEEEIGRQSFDRIDAGRELEITRDAVRKERHGGITDKLGEGLRGVGAGLTLGVTELALAPGTAIGRAEARDKRQENQAFFTGGEIAGGIGGALLPGSQARFLTTLGRLSPTARVAALAGHVAARGTTPLARIGRQALGGAFEGAAQSVGSFIANEALNENRDFSAESLAGAAGMGALLGGGIAGGIGIGGEVVRGVRGRIARRIAAEGSEGLDPAAFAALDQPELLGGGVAGDAFFQQRRTGIARRRKGRTRLPGQAETADEFLTSVSAPRLVDEGIPFSEVVSPSTQRRTAETWGELASHVDDQGVRAATAQVDGTAALVNQLDNLAVSPAVTAEVRDVVQRRADDLLAASNNAKSWFREASAELGDVNLGTASPDALLRALPDELEDRGAVAMAQLDEATEEFRALERGMSEAIDQGNREALAVAGDEVATAGIGARVANTLRSRIGGVRQSAETVLGAAELAKQAGFDPGIPTVSDIPIVGDALSLWVRFKAGSNALRKAGVLPATASTRAAGTVNNARTRIASMVGKVAASAAARRITVKSAPVLTRQLTELEAQSPEVINQRAMASVDPSMPEIAAQAGATAVRAHRYLLDNAPRSPFRDAPFKVSWAPTQAEALIWQRRVDAVADPLGAVRQTMREPFPDLEAEVLRDVYPQIYEAARTDLLARANKISPKLPDHRLQALGRAYRVPLVINQLPNYPRAGTSVEPPAVPQPTDVARGPGPTTSPSVTTELTADQAQARGRV